jgi:hypothetical protein
MRFFLTFFTHLLLSAKKDFLSRVWGLSGKHKC